MMQKYRKVTWLDELYIHERLGDCDKAGEHQQHGDIGISKNTIVRVKNLLEKNSYRKP